MKYVGLLLLAVILLGLPLSVSAEVTDPLLTDPNRMYADITEGSGIVYKSLMVTNIASEDRVVTISWDYYTGAAEGEILAPEPWFSASPNNISVPAGLPMIFNICVNVPKGTSELVYKAYLKVADGTGYSRHVVVWVRVGKAVPSYEFSITQGLYDATLTESGIGQCEVPNFGIRNTGTGICEFRITSELPNGESDPSYEVAPYTGGGDDISYDWVTIDADPRSEGLQGTVKVPAYETSWANIKLEVPEDVPNGKYKMWIGVNIAEETGQTIGIGYAAKVRLVVDRPLAIPIAGKPFVQKFWLPIVCIVALAATVLAIVKVLRQVRGKRDKPRRINGNRRYAQE